MDTVQTSTNPAGVQGEIDRVAGELRRVSAARTQDPAALAAALKAAVALRLGHVDRLLDYLRPTGRPAGQSADERAGWLTK